MFIASVIVTDDSGAADTASMTLTVLNTPPVISVSPPVQQAVGDIASAGFAVFDSGGQDKHTIAISWGDGTRDSIALGSDPRNKFVAHTYAQPGSYWVKATARDEDGGVTVATAANAVLVFDATAHKSVAGYDVFDLGTLGGNSTRPLDFNDFDKVVGSSLTASGGTHAFLWDNGVLRDLGTLGNEGSEAQRINNAGLIAGSVWSGRSDDCPHPWNAATWRDGNWTVLGRGGDVYSRYPTTAATLNESGDIVWTACGHENPYAWLWRGDWQRLGGLIHPLAMSHGTAINERGQIAGASAAASGNGPNPVAHAFLWENGAMRDLGLLGFRPCRDEPDRNCGWSGATGINESGQVVGYSTGSDAAVHAVLWENGTIRDLWTVPTGAYEARVVINDVGQVAGSGGGEAFFWSGGVLQALGSLGGGRTDVVDMNEAGTIVGTGWTASGEQHAFVWTQGRGMVDLGTGPPGFSGAWVVGISFRGDVVGYTAPCKPAYYGGCEYPSQVRAVMWRNTRGNP